MKVPKKLKWFDRLKWKAPQTKHTQAASKHTTTMANTLKKGDVVFKVASAKKDACRYGVVYDVKETPKGTKVKVEYNTPKEGDKSRFSTYQSPKNFVKVPSSWREWYSWAPPAEEESAKTEPPKTKAPKTEPPKTEPPKPMKETHYSVLGIAKTATELEIKKAYRKAVLKAHPDKGGSSDLFRKVQHAYEMLRDTEKRARYDIWAA